MESIGGLVTCANNCLKYLNNICGFSDKTASDASERHRTGSFLSIQSHWKHYLGKIFFGVSENSLAYMKRLKIGIINIIWLGQ